MQVQRRYHQSGQVGIAVVLVMVVLSTVGISLATRATQDVQTSRQSQEAAQTFSAAESALEDILSRGQTYLEDTETGQFTAVENVDVGYTIQQRQELTTELLEGSVAEIDVSGGNAGQRVLIEWSEFDTCDREPASLVVSIVNTLSGTPVARTFQYAICDNADGFELVSTNGSTLVRQVAVTLEDGDTTVRIMPLYNDTDVLVNGDGWTLPTQQFTINTVARNELGRETKAIEVQRTNEYAPSVLDYALVSGTDIVK